VGVLAGERWRVTGAPGRTKVSRLWLSALGLAALSALSLLITEMDYRRAVSSMERTAVALDNLTRARVAVAEAAVAWGAIQSGDPTYDRSRPAAHLAVAVGALEDLLAGRSALSAFRSGRPPGDPSFQASVRTYLELVRSVRDESLAAGGPADAVTHRLRLGELGDAATQLELGVYRAIRGEVADKRRRHVLILTAWGAFLAVVLGGFVALRTARLRAQLESARAEHRYTALERLAAVGVLRVDAEGTVREATDWWSRLLGTEGDGVGMPWWRLLLPQERDHGAAFWCERAAAGAAFPQEAQVVDGQGKRRWLAGRWEPGRTDATGAREWVGAFMDVTEQRAVEAQLHQAQKLEAVGRLSGGLAHDFNNLLSVILTNTHLLLSEPGSLGPEEVEMLTDVDRAAKSGRDLVKRLMGFSRRGELSLADVDLSAAVRQAAILADKLVEADIALELSLPEPGPTVRADARGVEQILLNLVANARDAMPGGGVIRVSVDEVEADAEFLGERPWVAAGRYGRITVSDEGVGMDEATLGQAFEPFFTTKPEGKGTGLGLATVHGLMRQHGGHVRAYSHPGEGTTFRLYFPCAVTGTQAEGEGVQASVSSVGANAPERDLAILLVEDDAALRRTSARMLSRLGFRVIEAEGGEEALRILADPSVRVDIVMSDLSMPGIGGVELYGKLRAHGDPRPVILTSGLSERDASGRAILPEGVPFLPKPWGATQLLDLIDSLDTKAG